MSKTQAKLDRAFLNYIRGLATTTPSCITRFDLLRLMELAGYDATHPMYQSAQAAVDPIGWSQVQLLSLIVAAEEFAAEREQPA